MPKQPSRHIYDLLNGKRRLAAAALVVLATVTLVIGLSAFYVSSLSNMIRSESTDYLSEISKQVTENASNLIESKLQLLSSASATVQSYSNDPLDSLVGALATQADNLGFERIAAIDSNGVWHFKGSSRRFPEFAEYVSQTRSQGKTFVPAAQNIDGEDYVLFFAPVENTVIEGTNIYALGALVRLDTLGQLLAPKTFDGESSTDIVTTSGSVIVQSDPAKSLATGYNLLADLGSVRFTDGTTAASLSSDIQNGESGICRYDLNGHEYVSYYSEMPNHDWLLFCTVPAEALDAQPEQFVRLTVIACLIVACCIIALMGAVMYVQNRSSANLMRLAFEDRVTGGPTRDKLVEMVNNLQTRPHGTYAVVYVNIEHFKSINDRFGTEEADRLLRVVHETFLKSTRAEETAARLSADHFALLLKASTKEQAHIRLRDINDHVAARCAAGSSPYSVRLTYGAYLTDNLGPTADILIDRANLARKSGVAYCRDPRLSFYDDTLKETMRQEQEIEDRMEDALANGEFCAYLQPQYSACSEEPVGFEALARWVQPDGSLLPPDRFIPLFERNGFIVQLDLSIFEQVCRIQRARLDLGKTVLPISVNVSRTHLMSIDPMAPYRKVLDRYNLPNNLVAFEFTESIMYDDPDRLDQVVDELHRNGFLCSMDDFGTGYSSLGMLNRTNIDIVKLDRSFLGMDKILSERSVIIIESIISLAKGLGLQIIAEGVEHKEQVEFLRSCGCDCIQGFFYARPMPADEALKLIDKERPSTES